MHRRGDVLSARRQRDNDTRRSGGAQRDVSRRASDYGNHSDAGSDQRQRHEEPSGNSRRIYSDTLCKPRQRGNEEQEQPEVQDEANIAETRFPTDGNGTTRRDAAAARSTTFGEVHGNETTNRTEATAAT